MKVQQRIYKTPLPEIECHAAFKYCVFKEDLMT